MTLDPTRAEAWQSFLAAIRPPRGYELESGVGTSYGLSPEMLIAALLGFIEIDGDATHLDVTSAIRAITRLESRLRVFIERASVHGLESAPAVFGLFDRVLREVPLPFSGSLRPAFHPKVWALCFQRRVAPESGSGPRRIFRLLCGSRNLTTSRYWELGASFEGVVDENGSEFGRDVAALLRQLLGANAPRALRELIANMRNVRFETSREMADELRFRWSWPSGPALRRILPAAGRRALVVSPFLKSDFLDLVADRFDQLVIVSSQSELDALPDRTHERLSQARKYVVMPNLADEELALDELHAKLVVCEGDDDRVTLLGSANATGAAWGCRAFDDDGLHNCEAVVQMRPGLSIETFLREFVRDKAWISDYERAPVEDDDLEELEGTLDDWAAALARTPLEMSSERTSGSLRLRSREPEAPVPVCHRAGAEAWVAPMLLRQRVDAFRPFAGLGHGGIVYENVPIESVARFVVLRVRLGDVTRTCGLLADSTMSDEEQNERDDALRARLLEDADPRKILEAILWRARRPPRQSAAEGSGEGGNSGPARQGAPSWFGEISIERVLEVCTESDAVVEEIDAILRALAPTGRVDPAFESFWNTFRAARATVQREER